MALLVAACTDRSPEQTFGSTSPASTVVPAPGSSSSSTTRASVIEDEALPIDPDVRIGRLENGLTYYLRHNDRPGQRVELRLVVDAGSVLEEDDQSGGAHFLEHMMFNGTERFPVNELIAFLEAFGPRFGPDINAYTSFDETVYELSVPTDDPAVVRTAVDVLFEWATRATIAPDDVADERGVVVEEWRLRELGLDGRINDAFGELMLPGTSYEGREPIGRFESISEMEAEPLERFYRTWYRPDLMAVVVVGDIDVDEMEDLVTEVFASLTGPSSLVARPEVSVAPATEPRAVSVEDEEVSTATVDLLYVSRHDEPRSRSEAVAALAGLLARIIMEQRLLDDAWRGTAPWYQAEQYEISYARRLPMTGFSVTADPADLAEAARVLFEEVERVRRFGFTEDEFGRAVEIYEAINEQSLEGQETIQDNQFADQYVGHFLEGSPILSVEQRYELERTALESLELAEVAQAFLDLTETAPRMFVVGPDVPAGSVPSAGDLRSMMEAVQAADLSPRPPDQQAPEQLMAAPDAVPPISAVTNESFGYAEVDYANGARVIFWSTSIAENLVSFRASSFGGTSQVDVPDLVEARLGVDMVARSGLGELDRVAVDRALAGSLASVNPVISETHEGFVGVATTDDLEVLFQMLHLLITEPRLDDVAVGAVLSEMRPRVERPEEIPDLMVTMALSEAYYGPQDDRHWVVPPPAEFEAFDRRRALEIYRERFGEVGDFLFVFVGDLDPNVLAGLANRYIGTLPGTPGQEGFIDHQPLPSGISVETVQSGQGNQGLVRFAFTGRYPDQDLSSDVAADLLQLIAGNRLRDRLRERLAATYSPSIGVDMQLEPDPYVETAVSVTGDPGRLDEIAAEVLADVEDLRTNGPTAEELAIAQEQLFREYELVNNPFLLDRVIFYEEHEEREVVELTDRYGVIETVTIEDLRAMAAAAFPADRYILVKLVPDP